MRRNLGKTCGKKYPELEGSGSAECTKKQAGKFSLSSTERNIGICRYVVALLIGVSWKGCGFMVPFSGEYICLRKV